MYLKMLFLWFITSFLIAKSTKNYLSKRVNGLKSRMSLFKWIGKVPISSLWIEQINHLMYNYDHYLDVYDK